MDYKYKDRPGQVAELYAEMILEFVALGVSVGMGVKRPSEECRKQLEVYRPEVERLDHPILTDAFGRLEKLLSPEPASPQS